jgi:hypothetical protein
VSIVPAAARTTTTTGAAVNVHGFERVDIVVCTGTVTDGTYDISLTECDTVGGTYTEVVAADIIHHSTGSDVNGAIVPTTGDDDVYVFGYRGSKQFIKVVATAQGTPSTGAVYAACVLGRDARRQPVTTP